MALQEQKLLATATEILKSRFVSKNIKDEVIVPSIKNAQLVEIRRFLGDMLYTALINDYDEGTQTFTAVRFTELWQGVEFTATGNQYPTLFPGLQWALHHYALERYAYEQKHKTYRDGERVVTSEFSEARHTRPYEVNQDSMGLMYQRDAEIFLNTNRATYPEWRNTTPNEVGFNFKRVGEDVSV